MAVGDATLQAANVSLIEGGGVRITVTDVPNEGGELKTNAKYSFGYYECRCLIPSGGGMHPAFWLSDRDHAYPRPEIDVEYFGGTNLYFATHLGGNVESQSASISGDWHVFGVRWTSEVVDFYIDNAKVAAIRIYIPQVPMQILLQDLNEDYLARDPAVVYPVQFDTDYIKYWEFT